MSTMYNSTQVSRYVALDVHRTYLVVGAVDSQQHIVLSPCALTSKALPPGLPLICARQTPWSWKRAPMPGSSTINWNHSWARSL